MNALWHSPGLRFNGLVRFLQTFRPSGACFLGRYGVSTDISPLWAYAIGVNDFYKIFRPNGTQYLPDLSELELELELPI